MIPTQVNYRRGTAAQVAVFTPSTGEIVVDLTNSRIVVGDAVTVGGFTGAKLTDVTSAITTLSGAININLTGKYLTGLVAGSNITVNNNNNGTFTINGNAGGGGGILTGTSGSYIFSNISTSGVSQEFILFPAALGSNPYVICTLSNETANELLFVQTSGITSSGYWARYSSSIDSSGYLLTTIASISTATGLATTIINNTTIQTGTSNTILSGNLTSTGQILYNNITGLSGVFNGQYNALSGALVSTGQTLYNDIIGLSGTLGSLSVSNVVYTSGNQTISGTKIFSNIQVTGSISGTANIYDAGGTESIDFNGRHLYAGDGSQSMDYSNRQLSRVGGTVIDWGAGNIYDQNGSPKVSIDFVNRLLKGSGGNGNTIMNWGGGYINDNHVSPFQMSIDFFDRLLTNTGNQPTLDWQNSILTGIWNAQALSVSGFPVITTGMTGGFGGGGINTVFTGNTGSYIFSLFAVSGSTSQFIKFPTNLGSNPYVLSSLNNISGIENIFIQTSGITSSGFWVNYSNTIDSSGYLLTTMASISSSTGLATTVIIQGGSANITTWVTLPWSPIITWNTTANTIEDKAIVTLTGNCTLSIVGLYNGWNGVLEVIQSGVSATGYDITLPANTKVNSNWSGIANLSNISGAIDMMGFVYDGINLFMSLGNNYN